MRRRELVAKNAWSSRATTKHFFWRICSRFGDNTIPTLVSQVQGKGRHQHDKANIIADNWEQIFNGSAETKEGLTEYVERHKAKWNAVDMTDVEAKFTVDEVRAAIRAYKRDKACGPDELSNA